MTSLDGYWRDELDTWEGSEPPTAEDAFIGGTRVTTEGWNGEYGLPSDEWLRLHYRRWLTGEELPNPCGVRVDPEKAQSMVNPACTRPAGHEGQHNQRDAQIIKTTVVEEW